MTPVQERVDSDALDRALQAVNDRYAPALRKLAE